jgi:arylsulfatase
MGARDSLLTFIGPDLVAARWKQWRLYFKEMHMTGGSHEMNGGLNVSSSNLYYPKVFNIEMDPHEEMELSGIHLWTLEFAYRPVKEYLESLKKYPNPPAPDLTNFKGRGKG